MSSKPCKFECGMQLSWDNNKKKFVEPDGTEHSKDRCESLKSRKTPVASSSPEQQRQLEIQKAHQENLAANTQLVNALTRLASAIETLARKELK